MKIEVDRTVNSEGELIFTVKVIEPHLVPFYEVEKNALTDIDNFTKEMSQTLDPNGILYQDILNANHKVKEKVFCKVLESLKFSIENEFRPKFKPICQEIYNWIYDHQTGCVKTWMYEFNPQRTTYYFDNDLRMQNQLNDKHVNTDVTEVVVDDEDEEE